MGTTFATSRYMICGGRRDRERLRILSRALRAPTLGYFKRAGIEPGSTCLDAGCGGGDVTLELARLVGPNGKVIGIDIDAAQLKLAAAEAAAQGVNNVEFRLGSLGSGELQGPFDAIYCRFVLTHLSDPADVLAEMLSLLRPGGKLLVADIDSSGYFWYPDCSAQERFLELYTESSRRHGGDPEIGKRLPELLAKAGFRKVRMNVVQPAALKGELKLITPLTLQNIAEALIAEGLASGAEIQELVAELFDFARQEGTICAMPRIVEAWGERAAE